MRVNQWRLNVYVQQRAHRMWDKGDPTAVIARACDVTTHTVRRWATEGQWAPRTQRISPKRAQLLDGIEPPPPYRCCEHCDALTPTLEPCQRCGAEWLAAPYWQELIA